MDTIPQGVELRLLMDCLGVSSVEVAVGLGVCPATVSYALGPKGAEGTRERIEGFLVGLRDSRLRRSAFVLRHKLLTDFLRP